MAKKIVNQIKLQIPAGAARPAPPVGPALGQAGVNIKMFCDQFNDRTKPQAADGMVIPVVITVYADRSFTFETKVPPVSALIKKAAGLATQKKPGSGSGEPNRRKVGSINMAQVRKIAEQKLPDLNATKVESAMSQVMGTARSMGVDVTE